MSAIQRLNQALKDREIQANKFFITILDEIDFMIENLSSCDHSDSTPEVANSVNLSVQELESLIAKIKDETNISEVKSNGIAEEFNRKVGENGLARIAPLATTNTPAPNLWQRVFGRPRAASPAAPAAPAPSVWDRLLGRRPVNPAERSQWENYVQHPNNLPTAQPVYQAEAYYSNPSNPYRPKGGRKRTRKYRRKI